MKLVIYLWINRGQTYSFSLLPEGMRKIQQLSRQISHSQNRQMYSRMRYSQVRYLIGYSIIRISWKSRAHHTGSRMYMKRLTNATFDIEIIVHFYIKTFVHFDIDIYNSDWFHIKVYLISKTFLILLPSLQISPILCWQDLLRL